MPMDDNPFAPGGATTAPGSIGGGSLDPVPMEVQPILTRCWELFTANPLLVFGAVLLPAIPAVIIGVADGGLQIAAESDYEMASTYAIIRLGLTIASTLIGVFFQLGMVRIFLNLARGDEADIGMLVGGGRHYLAGFLASIIVGVAVMLGFILLIIPGIILSLGLQFTFYALVDRDLGAMDAVTESWRITDGHKVSIFVINFVIGILAIVFSCITLGIGYFAVVPVLSLTQAVMYHSLTQGGGGYGGGLSGLRD